jgi:hypothetical protein
MSGLQALLFFSITDTGPDKILFALCKKVIVVFIPQIDQPLEFLVFPHKRNGIGSNPGESTPFHGQLTDPRQHWESISISRSKVNRWLS